MTPDPTPYPLDWLLIGDERTTWPVLTVGAERWNLTELDEAVNAFQATISGISGDSLLSDLPTIVGDLERIDTAWKALDEQITQTCG